MARFESTGSGSGQVVVPGKYKAKVVEFTDITSRISQYADIGIEMKVSAETISFELKTTMFIKFERKPNGELDADKNTWSGQMNSILDAIDYNGGFDRYGVFRNPNGDEVDDIAAELSQAYMTRYPDDNYTLLVFVEPDKKGYSTIKRRVFKVNEEDKMDAYVAASAKLKAKAKTQPASGTSARKL